MTNEDVIRMAQEAGLHIATDHDWMPIIALAYAKKLVEVARAEEREENAKLCNSLARWHGQLVTAAFDHAADSIRYKGQQTSTNEQDEQLRARSTYYGNNP